MTKFLCAQHTYYGIEVALFNNDKILQKVSDDKKSASKNFVSLVDILLKNNNCYIDQISFIATNIGPGPFTTMRVVLSCVSGLSFSTKKPIVGVDAFDAIFKEFLLIKNNLCRNFVLGRDSVVVLLDAFSKDVYFCYFGRQGLFKGCENIDSCLQKILSVGLGAHISSSFSVNVDEDFSAGISEPLDANLDALCENKKVYFLGNAAKKYQEKIIAAFSDTAIIVENSYISNVSSLESNGFPAFSSIEQVGKLAFEKWQKGGDFDCHVMPLYLKPFELKS